MSRKRTSKEKFEIGKFNKKHLQLLNFWKKGSPHKDVRYVVADGAVRAGKTITMIISFIQWSMQFKGKEFALFGKTHATLHRNLVKNFIKIANTFNLQPVLSNKDGVPRVEIGSNIYWLYDANNSQSEEKIQGITLQGSILDEVALFPDNVIKQIFMRHSDKQLVDGELKRAKIWMNCNPESPYHYVKTNVIDLFDKDEMFYLTFYLEDNLNLDKQTIQEIKGSVHGVFYDRNILGKWVLAQGRIYDMFDTNKHIVKTEDRYYEEFIVSSDFGIQNAQTFLLFGRVMDKWYLVKEYYYSGRDNKRTKDTSEYVEDFKREFGQYGISKIIIDPSAAALKASFNKAGFHILQNAKNDITNGIQEVQRALSEDMIFINDCCVNTIKEFETYAWDNKSVENGREKPIMINDHAMDAFRYFVFTHMIRGKSIEVFKW